MNSKVIAIVFSVLLIATLTLSAMGRLSWLYFWLVALLAFGYTKLIAKKFH